jgi:beta-lactam-binding protein with PASTA domain
LQTAYQTRRETDDASLDDLTPVDFSAQSQQTEESAKPAASKEIEQKPPEVTLAVDEGGDIAVPDFAGKTMREITEVCLRLGLDPVLVGSGVASEQTPEAGTKVRRGTKVTVEFATALRRTGKPR